jgi:hypothetical protein
MNESVHAASPISDVRCSACGFYKHSHGVYSLICPVLVKGMLSMFRTGDAS